jgi:hypothetical protein
MAPEQARPGTPTPAADVFALATIAFEALSGMLPRWGRTVVAILAQARSEPPADLREHRPGTPAGVADALIRGMSPVPEERHRSASALLRDLADGFAAAPAPAVEPAPTRAERKVQPRARGNRRTRTLAFAALVLAVIATVAVVANRPSAPSRATSSAPVARATPARTPRSEPTRAPASTATPAPASPSPATPASTATPSSGGTLSATGTVRAFYRRAAAGDYARAWSLAGPRMRQAFGNSLQRFSRDLASLQQIRFERVAVVARDKTGATVDIRTVATHANRVDRCTGTLRAIRRGGRWLVEPAGVRCTSG